VYTEIKTDDVSELLHVFERIVKAESADPSLLTLRKDEGYYSLSVNTQPVCAEPSCPICFSAPPVNAATDGG
jgi:hypothetical protein